MSAKVRYLGIGEEAEYGIPQPEVQGVAASGTTGVEGNDNGITWTAVQVGAAGNDIVVVLEDPDDVGQALAVSVAGSTVIFSLATDGAGAITSTAAQVIAAVAAEPDAAALISGANTGASDGTGVVVDEIVQLNGGITEALTTYLDVASATLDVPGEQHLIWRGVNKRAASSYALGPYVPQGDLVLPVDHTHIGWLLKWALGAVASAETEPGSGIYVHTFTPADTLPSFTARLGKDIFEHQFAGCIVDSLEIELEKDTAVATIGVVASKDKKNALPDPLPAMQNVYLFGFSRVTVALGGPGGTTLPVERFTLSINNNADGEDAVRLGSRFPAFASVGEREVSLSIDLTFENTGQLERFWSDAGAVEPSSSAAYLGNIAITMTGLAIPGSLLTYRVQFLLPRCLYQGIQQRISGRDRLKQTLNLAPIYDTGAGYEIAAELRNQKTGY